MRMASRLPVAILLGLAFAWTSTLAVISWLPSGVYGQMAFGVLMAPLVWAIAITWMSLTARPQIVFSAIAVSAVLFGAAAALHHWPLW